MRKLMFPAEGTKEEGGWDGRLNVPFRILLFGTLNFLLLRQSTLASIPYPTTLSALFSFFPLRPKRNFTLHTKTTITTYPTRIYIYIYIYLRIEEEEKGNSHGF